MRANIDIDDALLSQAAIAAGLSTKRATIEESLRRLVRVHEQVKALTRQPPSWKPPPRGNRS